MMVVRSGCRGGGEGGEVMQMVTVRVVVSAEAWRLCHDGVEWRLWEEIEVAVGVRCGGDEMDMMLMMA
nr:hypothetical protein [Tanacetum cinerariifolium]